MKENKVARKWFDYFGNIRNKYDIRLGIRKTLIVSLDENFLSVNKRRILENKENIFFSSIEKTVKYFTTKYKCLAIFGNNKISFIIEDINNFVNSIHNDKKFRVHDIASVFSQYFFEYFNNIYDKETIFWNCRCFNIQKEKVHSYIKFMSQKIFEEIISNFLKQKKVNDYGIKLNEKLKMCKSYKEYSEIDEYKYGILYYDGDKIDLNEYLRGNIKKVEKENEKKNFFDLVDFDNSIQMGR